MLERRDRDKVPRLRLGALFADSDPQQRLHRYDREAEPAAEDDDSGTPSVVAAAAAGLGGRLTERWVPGGGRSLGLLRRFVRGRRVLVLCIAVVLAAGILVVVGLRSSAPSVERPPALPAAAVSTMTATTSEDPGRPVVVSVVGKVAHPGLVTVSAGARVADAIEAAGGSREGAPMTAVNLARKLRDGEQIYVGIPRPGGAASPGIASAAPGGSTAPAKVDINTANAAQLEELPGIGPVTAKKILAWRSKHGRFASVGQLRDVRGIGDATLADLRDLVTVG